MCVGELSQDFRFEPYSQGQALVSQATYLIDVGRTVSLSPSSKNIKNIKCIESPSIKAISILGKRRVILVMF